MTLEQIETMCGAYAERRAMLAGRLSALDAALREVKRKHLRELKRQVGLTAEIEAELRAAIETAPELFEKPKTRIFHGVKVGFRKGKGKMDWEDDAALVALIKKKFPDHVDQLIITTEKPSATGLEDLDASELRKLGVTVEEAGDQVVIKEVETDVERLVKALLEDALEVEESA